MFRRIRTVLEMIKFEHSVFALPYALVAALLAARTEGPAGGWPTAGHLAWQLGWIVVAMVGARSAAMTMNRIADLRYDRLNPRTRGRALVTGELSSGFAWGFTLLGSAAMTMNRIADLRYDRLNPRTRGRALVTGELSSGFAWGFTLLGSAALVLAAWELNPLAFRLSPVALAVLFLYSYTKRFTMWSHLVLGFCLGMSPAAAWIAMRGALDWRMLILCAAVTLWVGGFDVLYACQDIDFDREAGLHSIPRWLGIQRSLVVARAMHAGMILLLGWLAASFHLAWPAWAGIVVVAGLLAWEHRLVRPNDLSKINAAFFTMNGYISVLFLVFWGAAVCFGRP